MPSFLLRRGAVLASASLLFVAGCSATADSAGKSVDDIQTATPIAPVDFVRCWITPDTEASSAFFQEHTFTCERPASDYPLRPAQVIVEVHTARQSASYAIVGDGETKIAGIRNEDFPLRVFTKLQFGASSSVGDSFGLKEERAVPALADIPKDRPLSYTSPFAIWGVAIEATRAELLHFADSSYVVPTGSFKVGWNFTIPDDDTSLLSVRTLAQTKDGRLELALLAPPSGSIELDLDGVKVAIAGPGTFTFDGTTLDKQAGPGPDVVEPPPPPTCGTEGQALCPGNTCAPDHRLEQAVCHPCGSDGQTYCGTSNSPTCSPGHRVENGLCQVCGGDGQTYCGSYNSPTCSPGHRVEDGLCQVCGGDGQTYCGSYNSPTCSPGHRVEDGLCRVCGGDGQTYCGSYNSPTCNEGLRVVNGICSR